MERDVRHRPTIELHIEELVLHGFLPGDRHRIRRALQRELTRLVVEGGVPEWPAVGGAKGPRAAGNEIERLDVGAFEVAPGAGPEVVGAQVAAAVYRGTAT